MLNAWLQLSKRIFVKQIFDRYLYSINAIHAIHAITRSCCCKIQSCMVNVMATPFPEDALIRANLSFL